MCNLAQAEKWIASEAISNGKELPLAIFGFSALVEREILLHHFIAFFFFLVAFDSAFWQYLYQQFSTIEDDNPR